MTKRKDPPDDATPATAEHDPTRADPEAQPFGAGRRRRQEGLPGVYDGVKKYPKLDLAMIDLREKLDEVNKAKLDYDDQKTTVQEMRRELGIPSYAIEGLMVGTTEKEERLYVKRLKPPKQKKAAGGDTQH